MVVEQPVFHRYRKIGRIFEALSNPNFSPLNRFPTPTGDLQEKT